MNRFPMQGQCFHRRLVAITAMMVFLMAYAGVAAASPLPPGTVADYIIVEKASHRLTLYQKHLALKTYAISLGFGGVGPKQHIGDGLTPQGLYTIDGHNQNSRYHLSLHISYPGPRDIAWAGMLGVRPGGDIMIHGLPNGAGWFGRLKRLFDWTAGCIAVTDRDIEEIAAVVPDGTPIEIRP